MQGEAGTSARPAFGTAHLMGRLGPRQSAKLLYRALDCGVTHFDTARLYGLGDAEEVVGRVLGRREDVTIFTKVGQGPPSRSWVRSQAYAIARPLARMRGKFVQPGARVGSSAMITKARRTNFSANYVRESVETSLKLLRREALDGLLLHEVTAKDLGRELLDTLERLVDEGKIRMFGIASELASLKEIENTRPIGEILQQPGGAFTPVTLAPNYGQLILHSVFGQKAQLLRDFELWLQNQDRHSKTLESMTASEGLPDTPSLLLSYASTRWPCSHIVFASSCSRRIDQNSAAIRHTMTPDTINELSVILNSYIASRNAAL